MDAVHTTKEPHQLEVGEWCEWCEWCEYMGTIYAECPGGLTANLGRHHVWLEDGLINMAPSILVNGAPGEAWHGYIRKGVWLDENEQPVK